MSWFTRKPKDAPSPLWDFVAQYDAKMVADWLERESKTAENSETFLKQVILSLTLSCAVDFLRNVGTTVRDGLPTANPDVIAFEGLGLFNLCDPSLPPPTA